MSSNPVSITNPLMVDGVPYAISHRMIDAEAAEAFDQANVFWRPEVITERQLGPLEASRRFPKAAKYSGGTRFVPDGTEPAGLTASHGYVDVSLFERIRRHIYIKKKDLQLGTPQLVLAHAVRNLARLAAEDVNDLAVRGLARAAQQAAVSGIHGASHPVKVVASDRETAFPVNPTGAANFLGALKTLNRSFIDDDINTAKLLITDQYMIDVALESATTSAVNRDFYMEASDDWRNRTMSRPLHGFTFIRTPSSVLPSTDLSADNENPSVVRDNFSVTSTTTQGQPVALAVALPNMGPGPLYGVRVQGITTYIGQMDENTNTVLCKVEALVGFELGSTFLAGGVFVRTT